MPAFKALVFPCVPWNKYRNRRGSFAINDSHTARVSSFELLSTTSTSHSSPSGTTEASRLFKTTARDFARFQVQMMTVKSMAYARAPALAFLEAVALPHQRARLFTAATGCDTPFQTALQNPRKSPLQLNGIPRLRSQFL